MRVGPFAIGLTLVLTFVCASLAAPPKSAPELTHPDEQSSPTAAPEKLELLEIANPPPEKFSAKRKSVDIFFPYQSSVSPRAGAGISHRRVAGSDDPGFYFIGLNYMLDSPNNRHLEIGIDLTSQTHGLLQVGYKWVYDHNSAFRPYLKAGPAVMLNPDEQLATFLKPSNFQLRIAGGFEKLLKVPMSLRMDLEAAWASGGYEAVAALGYAWAW